MLVVIYFLSCFFIWAQQLFQRNPWQARWTNKANVQWLCPCWLIAMNVALNFCSAATLLNWFAQISTSSPNTKKAVAGTCLAPNDDIILPVEDLHKIPPAWLAEVYQVGRTLLYKMNKFNISGLVLSMLWAHQFSIIHPPIHSASYYYNLIHSVILVKQSINWWHNQMID